jgi:amidase
VKLSEYARLDAIGLMDLIQRGEISAREAQACAYKAVELLNPQLNFIAGKLHAQPEWIEGRAFSGLPFLVKDGSGVAGFPQVRGSRLGARLIAVQDSAAVARQRNTGVAILGATTSPEFGIYPVTESSMHGITRNPWHMDHSPGGSSGGASAAVAAGVVPVAETGDGGGSIRGPAHCTGLFGLKPSRGRLPDIGGLFGLNHTHVSTRTVRDSAAFLDLTHGPAPGVRYHIAPPERSYKEEAQRDPGRLRIGFRRTSVGKLPLQAECQRAVDVTAALLSKQGHDVEEASPAVSWEALHRAFMNVWVHPLPAGVANLAALSGQLPGPDTLELSTLKFLDFARGITVADLVAAEAIFQAARFAVDQFFEQYDVWLSPACVSQAPRIGDFDPALDHGTVEEFSWRMIDSYAAFTPVFNVTGNPAASVPVIHGSNRLPVGVQLSAAVGNEAVLFRVSTQLEQLTRWHERRPPHSIFDLDLEVQ